MGYGRPAAVAAALAAFVGTHIGPARADQTTCALGNRAGAVGHVVYLELDGVHFQRDRAGIPSDLEQMPTLYGLLRSQGTLFVDDHAVLLAHSESDALTSLTGLYPDRTGAAVGDGTVTYAADGTPIEGGSLGYWTAPVGDGGDSLPALVTDGRRNTPAPWTPFTRAGCDVGAVGLPGLELQNASTAPSGDVTQVFGSGSAEWQEALTAPARAQTDLLGIALHCAQASTSRCAGSPDARADVLPDEPGGYDGYQALFGARAVDPAIAAGGACVADTTGAPIRGPSGACGFPGFDALPAEATLGYLAQMLEAGVQVVFGRVVAARGPFGPGDADFVDRLHATDAAFGAFLQRLAAHGIDPSNTLFVVTGDQGGHFAGGAGTPQPDGSLLYADSACGNLAACPPGQLGQLRTDLPALLPAGTPAFGLHAGTAAALFVAGQPARTAPAVRQLARDLAGLTSVDPYERSTAGVPQTVSLVRALADPIEESVLHLLPADPARRPTLTVFAHPDFALQDGPCAGQTQCADPGSAWSEGGIQEQIGTTWVGLAGPGVARGDVDAHTWTDHANLRPTMLALLGLRDDYVHDGHVLLAALAPQALPGALAASARAAQQLGAADEQLNAPFGAFATNTLATATRALASGSASDDSRYLQTAQALATLARRRNALASKIESTLDAASFGGRPVSARLARTWSGQAYALVAHAVALNVLRLTRLP